MTDLDCPKNVAIRRVQLNNDELHSLQNELKQQNVEQTLYRDELSSSFLRTWSCISALYKPPFPDPANQDNSMARCDE